MMSRPKSIPPVAETPFQARPNRREQARSIRRQVLHLLQVDASGDLTPIEIAKRHVPAAPTALQLRQAWRSGGLALRGQYTPVLGCFQGLATARAICATRLYRSGKLEGSDFAEVSTASSLWGCVGAQERICSS